MSKAENDKILSLDFSSDFLILQMPLSCEVIILSGVSPIICSHTYFHVIDFSINNQYHILNALKDSNPLLRDKQ